MGDVKDEIQRDSKYNNFCRTNPIYRVHYKRARENQLRDNNIRNSPTKKESLMLLINSSESNQSEKFGEI